MLECLDIRAVTSKLAILNHATPRGASFPPVVRLRPDTHIFNRQPRSTALVQRHQAVGILLRGIANRRLVLRIQVDSASRGRDAGEEHSSRKGKNLHGERVARKQKK